MKRFTLVHCLSVPSLLVALGAGCGGDDDVDSAPEPSRDGGRDASTSGAATPGDDASTPPDASGGDASGGDASEGDASPPIAEEPGECEDVEDGQPCGEDLDEAPCVAAHACQAGACRPVFAAEGTSCGAPSDDVCDAPDTCDGAGVCVPRFAAEGTACGDDTETVCDAPDSCDGEGLCRPNYAAQGTACGDTTVTDCNAADSCDGNGLCADGVAADGTACYDCVSGIGSCATCSASICDSRQDRCEVASTAMAATMLAGNNHRGNMFDLTALHTVTIERFDAHPMGDTTIAVYYRVGRYLGFETSPDGWTLLGSAAVQAMPYGTPTPVPVPVAITIPAGQSYSFYVTSTNTGVALHYTTGSTEGALFAADANLQFSQGVGIEYPFTGGTNAIYRPRIWNGVIHYSTSNAPLTTSPSAYAGATARGAMFDVQATGAARLQGLDLELAQGAQDLSVYFRRGSFVGHEASSAGWQPLGSNLGVVSAGDGALTSLLFARGVELATGETVGLYVDAHQAESLRVDTSAAVGDEAASNATLRVRTGTSLGQPFEAGGAPVSIRGVLQGSVCQQP